MLFFGEAYCDSISGFLYRGISVNYGPFSSQLGTLISFGRPIAAVVDLFIVCCCSHCACVGFVFGPGYVIQFSVSFLVCQACR